jgi:hypothetical protein
MAKTYSAGVTTAYGAAKRGGYTGTYEKFCSDLAQLADVLSEFLGFSVTVQTLAEGASATASYDDGVLALGIPRGNTGNGIQSIVLNADYTLTVTYTNGNTWTSGSIRGQVGATPHLTIGTVQTLEPGQSATAEITGTDENPVLNLGIPKGQAGASDAGGVSYDPEGSYGEGTVGAELQNQSRHLSDKQNAPATAGTAGQVLSLDSQLQPVWADQTGGGGDVSNCAPIIINTASGDIASFADGADNRQIRKIVGTIVPVQSGTGDPSPDNVRPISGWTGCELPHRGKNLFDSEKWGQLSNYPNPGPYGYYYADYIRLSPNTAYIASAQILGADASVVDNYGIKIPTGNNPQNPVTDAGSANTWIVNSGTVQNITFTTGPSGCITLMAHNPNAANLAALMAKQIQIELGSTATTFEAYHGNSILINWETEAGTIYGGTVTLNQDGSADVVSSYGIAKLDGTQQFGTPGSSDAVGATCRNFRITDLADPVDYVHAISDMFSFSTANIGNNPPAYKWKFVLGNITNPASANITFVVDNATLGIDDSLTRAEKSNAINAYFAQHNCVFCYQLATMQTYHFDNIGSLLTYYGQNNIWIDTGAITECDYPADTKLYIDGITAPDEDMIADNVIASGKYFVVNNQLYLSTAAIAKGAQIIPGTNCTATNLAEALNAINA